PEADAEEGVQEQPEHDVEPAADRAGLGAASHLRSAVECASNSDAACAQEVAGCSSRQRSARRRARSRSEAASLRASTRAAPTNASAVSSERPSRGPYC